MDDHEALDTAEHIVRNRDIPLLTRIYHTMKDIESLERHSDWQYERLFSVTKRLKGMPGGGGMPSGMEAVLAEVDELNHDFGEKIKQYVYELKVAERIMNGIESRTMRTFVQMYYIDNVGKRKIMSELDMSEWRFNQARESIENAEDMASVRWRERFLTQEG